MGGAPPCAPPCAPAAAGARLASPAACATWAIGWVVAAATLCVSSKTPRVSSWPAASRCVRNTVISSFQRPRGERELDPRTMRDESIKSETSDSPRTSGSACSSNEAMNERKSSG